MFVLMPDDAIRKGMELAEKYKKQLEEGKQKIYQAIIEYLRLIDKIAVEESDYELSIVLRIIQLRKIYYQFLQMLQGEEWVTGFIEDALGYKTKPKTNRNNKREEGYT